VLLAGSPKLDCRCAARGFGDVAGGGEKAIGRALDRDDLDAGARAHIRARR